MRLLLEKRDLVQEWLRRRIASLCNVDMVPDLCFARASAEIEAQRDAKALQDAATVQVG